MKINSTFYQLNGRDVIEIFNWMKDIKSSLIKSKYSKQWYAQVFHLDNKKSDPISDDDLDVLKFKCFVRAKDLGWDINLKDYNSEEILEIEPD